MNSKYRMLLLMTAVIGLTKFETLSQAAEPRFAVVHIKNKLDGDSKIYIRWVWPDGRVEYGWGKYQLKPGESRTFYYPYPGTSKSSPECFLRFDTQRFKGDDIWEYKLSRGGSPDWSDKNHGHSYSLVYVNSAEKFAELRATNPAKSTLTSKSSSRPETND